MGYAGGTKEQPTYRDLGDHTETVEVDFDPSVISYEELLTVFWRSHDPYGRPWSKQYSSIIFYHNEEQKELAVATREREAARSGRKISTQVVPAGQFYRAEDYHQKYYLRMQRGPATELRRSYPSEQEFVDSLIAARLNGYAAGHVSLADIQREMNELNPAAGEDRKVPDFLNR